MSKELNNLQDIKSAFISHCKELSCDENYIKVCENKFSDIEKSLKALEIIKEIISQGNARFRLEYTSDAMLVIEYWIMDTKLNEIKIPFDRNYYDLLEEVLL